MSGLLLVLLAGCGPRPGPQPVDDADRQVLLTVDDLRVLMPELDVAPERGRLDKVLHPDGGVELAYRYATEALRVHVVASNAPDESSARWAFATADAALLTTDADGLSARDAPGVLSWGDEQRCRVHLHGDRPVGTSCVARAGTRVYAAGVLGVVFSEPGTLDALLAEELTAFAGWSGK